MIPGFEENGYLPPGIHRATIEEIADRFGRDSLVRKAQVESLYWLIDLARRAGVRRLVINGSFVTETLEPNDVDCVLLVELGFPCDARAGEELVQGLPFMEIKLVTQPDFDIFVHNIFATDRYMTPKGTVEVIL